jgi:hypothetical protein
MNEIFEQLKEWLKWRRENYINDTEFYVDSGCSTCGGWDEEVPVIDEEALWAEIDAFCESFKEKQQ